MFDDVVLEAPDHHLVLEQQVQLVRVLAAADECHAVHDSALRSLSPSAPPAVKVRAKVVSTRWVATVWCFPGQGDNLVHDAVETQH